MNRSQRMIDAANESQEKFCQNELHQKTGKDYSGWTMGELVTEMKRLSDEIKDCSGKPVCGKFPDFCPCKSDISDCCGKPITLDKDSCTPVCTKCDQECNAVNPEPTPREE